MLTPEEAATIAGHISGEDSPLDLQSFDLEAIAAVCRQQYGPQWPASATPAAVRTIAAQHIVPGPAAHIDCPTWCDLEAGHRFLEDDHGLSRWHETYFEANPYTVTVGQLEVAAGAAGPIHHAEPRASLWFEGDHAGDELTGGDLRVLAATLLAAAAALDELETPALLE